MAGFRRWYRRRYPQRYRRYFRRYYRRYRRRFVNGSSRSSVRLKVPVIGTFAITRAANTHGTAFARFCPFDPYGGGYNAQSALGSELYRIYCDLYDEVKCIGMKVKINICNQIGGTDIPSLEIYTALDRRYGNGEANVTFDNVRKFSTFSMTTDTFPKECACEVTLTTGETVRIAGITKGSGMIAPNMGTMLSFIVSDAIIPAKNIKKALKQAADVSFNMIVVDGDESTNDTCLMLANGASGVEVVKDGKIDSNFQEALNYLCIDLAKKMARDGEGATKFIEANVCGAKDNDDAKLAAKSIISSSLFKSAVFGGDPNWGRIVSAIGYSGCDLNPDIVTIAIADEEDEVDLVRSGEILAFENTSYLERAEKIMQSKNVTVNIDMDLGEGKATAWGCDLTYDYVKINAEYTT